MKSMKKVIFGLALAFALSLAIPTISSAASNYYVTKCTTNLRRGPSTKYKVEFQLPAENVVKVTSKVNSNWYKVIYQNSNQQKFTGYVATTNVKAATYYKTTGKLNLRKKASETSAIVTVLPKGASIIVVNSSANKWYKSVYFNAGGKLYRGYVSKYYLTRGTTSLGSYVATGRVYMRSGASTSSSQIVLVQKGKRVTVKSFVGNFAYCTYKAPSGKTYTGYVSRSYLVKLT